MVPLKCLMLVVLGACGAFGLVVPEKGNWTVDNCIVLKMAAQVEVKLFNLTFCFPFPIIFSASLFVLIF